MFFLCTVEHYSIMKPVFLHKFKSYNKEIGKPDESLGRKATGPLKWQPVVWNDVHCLFDSVFLRSYFTDVTIMILSGKKYVKYEKGKTLSDSSGVSIPWILVKTGLIMKSSRLWQSVSLQTWMVLNGETVQRLQRMNFWCVYPCGKFHYKQNTGNRTWNGYY